MKHTGRIWNLHISRDGQYIVSSSTDHTACVWTLQGEEVFCTPPQDNDVTDAFLSNDSSILITASLDGKVSLWDVKTGSPLEVFDYRRTFWILISARMANSLLLGVKTDSSPSSTLIFARMFTTSTSQKVPLVLCSSTRAENGWGLAQKQAAFASGK
ncbi:MAG: hypothetical protein IPO22_02275 [Anaerolineales bacterium]|nr:hypothetical protein [Anaerolineales bacterium]